MLQLSSVPRVKCKSEILSVEIQGLERIAMEFPELPSRERLSVYNPSSFFCIDGETFCLVRVETWPYDEGVISSVCLARVCTDLDHSKVCLELLHPAHVILGDANWEDPWIGRLTDGVGIKLLVSVVRSGRNGYWQEIYQIERDFLNPHLLSSMLPIVSLPLGQKGVRFFQIGEKFLVFIRPQGDYELAANDRGEPKISCGKGRVGYCVFDSFQVAELENVYNKTFQFVALPEPINPNDTESWSGVNDVIDLGNGEVLIVYHRGHLENGKKVYTGHVVRASLDHQHLEIHRESAVNFSREMFDNARGCSLTLYDRDHMLYEIVYPSSATSIMTSSEKMIFIGVGISDCNTQFVKLSEI
ncbi:MAG: hypothetical protein NZO16_06555 [Deltaproteobacteria bacterium]|nr:hypothetical protein [Deltaproteobacteria bacterium]